MSDTSESKNLGHIFKEKIAFVIIEIRFILTLRLFIHWQEPVLSNNKRTVRAKH